MKPRRYPILEFDPARRAVLEPSRYIRRLDVPAHCVLCFFQDVLQVLTRRHRAREITRHKSEHAVHPLHEIRVRGRRLAVFHPGVGAPLAAGFLDELIARGCRKFIACGGAGVLNRDLAVGHLVVPTSAVRDEGTSYHYLPPAREVAPSPAAVRAIRTVLKRHGVPFVTGKTWTTDGIFRETVARVRRRRKEGCLTVEMEAAAFFAVARFRRVTIGQILYGGDDVSAETWDSRDWDAHAGVREKLFWLAAEACLEL